MKTNEKKNRHLTLEDRIEIQECLAKRMTFKAIGRLIGKDQTTVSKEVKLRCRTERNGFTKTDGICPQLQKAPFVCNGCDRRNRSSCAYPRCKYNAKLAQREYEETLRSAREGIPLNKESFYETERIISNAVRSGQNIYHAIHAHQLPVSRTTVYRHIEKGYYTISKIDLPRAVKFKPRRKNRLEYVSQSLRIGRTFEDFGHFTQEHTGMNVVEMDTVIGRVGGKLIMTFQFVNVDFMFGILLENKTAAEAAAKIRSLKEKLSSNGISFGDVFPLILTDNGGEFSDVFAFENSTNGQRETNMFFCDPNAPYQKPHVENNHTLFRGIVPSGSSFDHFTQDTVNLIFSHVNGALREQFNGKSAYDMFAFTYSRKLAALLGVDYIPPDQVIQTPKLLK